MSFSDDPRSLSDWWTPASTSAANPILTAQKWFPKISAAVRACLTERRNVKIFCIGKRPMNRNNQSSNYRTDEQLQSILHDTAKWVIHGRAGFALGHAASLQEALDKFSKLAQAGATISAITRLPSDSIIVFPGQVERLRQIVAGRDVPAVAAETLWSEAAD
jgi:hypothetical protein